MKYGTYLEQKALPEWREHYLNYNALKDLIDEATREEGGDLSAYAQRVTSLTVERPASTIGSANDRFASLLSQEVSRLRLILVSRRPCFVQERKGHVSKRGGELSHSARPILIPTVATLGRHRLTRSTNLPPRW